MIWRGSGGWYEGGVVVDDMEGEWWMIRRSSEMERRVVWYGRGMVNIIRKWIHIIDHSPYQNESEGHTLTYLSVWWLDRRWLKTRRAAVGPADESSHYKNKGRKVQVLPGWNIQTHMHTHTQYYECVTNNNNINKETSSEEHAMLLLFWICLCLPLYSCSDQDRLIRITK